MIYSYCICLKSFKLPRFSWWRHLMETFFALPALCKGNPPVTSQCGAVMFIFCCDKFLKRHWSFRWVRQTHITYIWIVEIIHVSSFGQRHITNWWQLMTITSGVNDDTVCIMTGFSLSINYPNSKVHWANMGPSWVLSDLDGSHVGPINLVNRVNNDTWENASVISTGDTHIGCRCDNLSRKLVFSVFFLLPRYGAFDLGLAVCVPLPIVTGIFVLLWFQSRLT